MEDEEPVRTPEEKHIVTLEAEIETLRSTVSRLEAALQIMTTYSNETFQNLMKVLDKLTHKP